MINRYIRLLPYPAKSFISTDDAKAIIAIPDEEIQYTAEEADWMRRSLENLDAMISGYVECGFDTKGLIERREQIVFSLQTYERSQTKAIK